MATHVLNTMAEAGQAVFGKTWPEVRAELAPHVKTMAIQGALEDFSRSGFKTIDLDSVRGGQVVLLAHVHTMEATGSTATTEFYSGGQQSMTSTVSEAKVSSLQGYAQAQADVLPVSGPANLSVIGRVFGGFGTEKTQTLTDNSATGILFRKKVATLTHVGVATVESHMFRPADGKGLGDKDIGIGKAQIAYVTRESPTDKQKHKKHVPREGIIQKATAAQAPPSDGPHNEQPRPDKSGLPARGLSHDSIARKIIDGDNFRDLTLQRLKGLKITKINDVVQKSLNDFRVASRLPAMTRVEKGNGVELLRYGNLRITGRADIQDLAFEEIEHEGGNAYVLNDVNQNRLNQGSKNRELGVRALIGPRFRLPFIQGYLLGGGGFSYRQRFDSIAGAGARLSANAKVSRSNAVFDATTRIILTVHEGDTRHSLGHIDVRGPILIPESETTPVDAPPEPVEEPSDHVDPTPDPVDAPLPLPDPGPSTTALYYSWPEIAARPTGDGQANRPAESDPSTAPRASLSTTAGEPTPTMHSAGLPIAHTWTRTPPKCKVLSM